MQKLMRRGFFTFIRKFEETATKTDHLPTIKYLFKAALRWVSPQFNPIHEGNTEQALAYIAHSQQYNFLKM
jgi:predicted metal-dependent hydrolase